MKKNWIDRALENSFKQFEKSGRVEKQVITIEMFKKNDFKSFGDVKYLRDLILKRFNIGKR